MSVTDGQDANQTTFNNAFVSKSVDSTVSSNIHLNDSDVTNGNAVTQIQREFNSLNSFVGKSVNAAKDVKPTWANNFYGSTTDDLQQRAEAHDVAIDGIQTQVDAINNLMPNKETFVLSTTDITNQYIDLSSVAFTDSIHFIVKGGGSMLEGALYDYSVDYTGGVGGFTRISFLNDLATGGSSELVSTDVVQVAYFI